MERSMESRKAMQDGTGAERDHEQAMRFFPRNEQFYTDSCPRCTGLLVNEWCYDFYNEGEQKAKVLRCVQCGYRLDSVIRQNQRRTTTENVDIADTWHIYPVSTAMSGEAA